MSAVHTLTERDGARRELWDDGTIHVYDPAGVEVEVIPAEAGTVRLAEAYAEGASPVALSQLLRLALGVNRDFLDTPPASLDMTALVAQMRALTRQSSALIRLTLGDVTP